MPMKRPYVNHILVPAVSLALALCLATLGIAPVPAQAAAVNTATAAVAQEVQDLYHVRVNGAPMTADPCVTNLNGVCYVSLRAVAQAILPNAQISWNKKTAAVSKSGTLSLTATVGQTYLVANGRYLSVSGGVQLKNNTVLVPLNTLLKAMDATGKWRADGSLDITTGSGGILSGDKFYDETDLYWLSRIINAESGNQPLLGKIAVGNVVLNRVEDARFPNTVYGVIYQKNQFSPAASGTVRRAPNAESVVAAKLCMDGAVALESVLYFNRVGLKCWAAKNRPFVQTIAGHSFYA